MHNKEGGGRYEEMSKVGGERANGGKGIEGGTYERTRKEKGKKPFA